MHNGQGMIVKEKSGAGEEMKYNESYRLTDPELQDSGRRRRREGESWRDVRWIIDEG